MEKKTKKTDIEAAGYGSIRKEIRGIIFLLIAIVLGVSLFTFHSDDPLFWIRSSSGGHVHNLFGTVGSHISGYLFHLIGFSSFWLIAVFLIMAVLSFSAKPLIPPFGYLVAVLILLISFSGINESSVSRSSCVQWRLNWEAEAAAGSVLLRLTFFPVC